MLRALTANKISIIVYTFIFVLLSLLRAATGLASDPTCGQLKALTDEITQLRKEIKDLTRNYYSYAKLLERIDIQKDVIRKKTRALDAVLNSIKAAENELVISKQSLELVRKDYDSAVLEHREELEQRAEANEKSISSAQKSIQSMNSTVLDLEIDIKKQGDMLNDLLLQIEQFM